MRYLYGRLRVDAEPDPGCWREYGKDGRELYESMDTECRRWTFRNDSKTFFVMQKKGSSMCF